MTEQNQNKERETLAAFAGLVILFAILAVLFGLTNPTIESSGTVVNDAEVAQVDSEVTQIEETEVAQTTAAPEQTAEADIEASNTEAIVDEATTDDSNQSAVEAIDSTEQEASTTISFDPEAAARGELLFVTCSACHGQDGRGIPGLGKDLVAGEFPLTSTDDEIAMLVTMGRPVWDAANTTGVDMPPKGGNPVLTSDDIYDIIAYIRSLQAAADTSATESSSTEAETNLAYDPELVALGQTLFVTCAGCHGADALGLPGLGKDLVASEFVHGLTDDELLAFIITGRPIWDAANTTGVDMPSKGGNPALSSEDLHAIVAYIRSLQP